LIDLPGVNAQEKTKKKLLESLKIGAEDILSTGVSFGIRNAPQAPGISVKSVFHRFY
jgi:hypothetical protein